MLTRTTLAIGDAIIALAYPWTSAQACGFISATILERGITMMMIKPSIATSRMKTAQVVDKKRFRLAWRTDYLWIGMTVRKVLRENLMPVSTSSSPSGLRIVDLPMSHSGKHIKIASRASRS
jgi:hypothetical protein